MTKAVLTATPRTLRPANAGSPVARADAEDTLWKVMRRTKTKRRSMSLCVFPHPHQRAMVAPLFRKLEQGECLMMKEDTMTAAKFMGGCLAALAVILLPTIAFAHTGVGKTSGFMHGFGHPISGLDHILTMVMVGVFA